MESAGKGNPILSVILPVRNEGMYIGEVLEDLLAQDFPRDQVEVFVVDGMSEDNTVEIASSYRDRFNRLVILDNPKKLASSARNIGYRAAVGDYVLFVDGHCRIPSRRLFADIVTLFSQHKVDALCRPQPQTAGPQTYFQQGVALARASALGHALDSTIYDNRERQVPAASSGAIYRREVFDRIGPFDESFDACEDVEFNTRFDRAGLRALISPKLTVEYAARTNLKSLFQQLFRYGYGRWKLFRKHPSSLGVGTLIPPVFVLGLCALPLLWLISWRAALPFIVLYAIYGVTVFFTSLTIARKHRKSLIWVLPLIFFTIHFAFGVGFLAAVVKSQRSGRR